MFENSILRFSISCMVADLERIAGQDLVLPDHGISSTLLNQINAIGWQCCALRLTF